MRDCADFLGFLKPKSSPVPLLRIGGKSDGAYLIPADLQGVVACFSPGVANFKSFEDELLDKYSIRSHLIDFSSDVDQFATPLRPGLQTFRKLWLDDAPGRDSITLDEWVQEQEPGNSDLLLQMDIEGAEYRTLSGVSRETLVRFRIVVLELHGLAVRHSPAFIEETVAPLLSRLERDFVCVHAHPNNAGGSERCEGSGLEVPRVLEVTLLRKDRFSLIPESAWNAPTIPNPLDLAVNCDEFPPLVLADGWCPGGLRSSAGRQVLRRIYSDFSGSCVEEILCRLSKLEEENIELRRRLNELSVVGRFCRLARRIRTSFRGLRSP